MENEITQNTAIPDHPLPEDGVHLTKDVKNLTQKIMLPAAVHAPLVPVATGPCDQVVANGRFIVNKVINNITVSSTNAGYFCHWFHNLKGLQNTVAITTTRTQGSGTQIPVTDINVGGPIGSNILTGATPLLIESSFTQLRSGNIPVRGLCYYKSNAGLKAAAAGPLSSNVWLYPISADINTANSWWVKVLRNVPAKMNGTMTITYYNGSKVVLNSETFNFAMSVWSQVPVHPANLSAQFISITMSLDRTPVSGRFTIELAATGSDILREAYTGSSPGYYAETLDLHGQPFQNDWPVNRFGYYGSALLVKSTAPDLTVAGSLAACGLPPGSLADDLPYSGTSLYDCVAAYTGIQVYNGFFKEGCYYAVLPPTGPAVYYDDDMPAAREYWMGSVYSPSSSNSMLFVCDSQVYGTPSGAAAKMLDWRIPPRWTTAHEETIEALSGIVRVTENPLHLKMVKSILGEVAKMVNDNVDLEDTAKKAFAKTLKTVSGAAMPRLTKVALGVTHRNVARIKKRRAKKLTDGATKAPPASKSGNMVPVASNNTDAQKVYGRARAWTKKA
jgi:hypothetical protein